MSITNTLNSVQNSLSSLTSSVSNVVNSATSAANTDFSALLSQATATTATAPTAPNPAAGKADFVSGQIGVNIRNGVPAQVLYFDEQGNHLKTGIFHAEDILRNTQQYHIPLTNLQGIGTQLDQQNIGYRPYELLPGTGSDDGIDFEDLINGGLGMAGDWRVGKNIAELDQQLVNTGVAGQYQAKIDAARALADSLGIVKNNQVTTERGIDPNRLTSLLDGAGQTVSHVVYTGGTASWYASAQAAQQAQASIGGTTLDLTDVAVPNVYLEQAAAEASERSAVTVPTTTTQANTTNAATLATSTPATTSTVSETTQPAAQATANTTDNTAASIPATRTLQDQLNDMVASLTNGGNISMSSYMSSYNQMQALLARMQSLQQSELMG